MKDTFTIEDLLGRKPVDIDIVEISQFINNKRVLITGAAGSIGSELVRQVAAFKPEQIILFDHNENNIFFLEKELKNNFPELKVIPRLGSICDRDRVKTIFEETMPHIVYHAAANKHVPLSEENISEAIHNNILGTHTIALAASKIKCEAFVMISTDKAVNPTSVMGTTKRIAELLIQIISNYNSDIRFVIVRFGNVLGSAGSVVPIFKSQIENGGPITITHPDMCRFFMTIPEASRLILQASAFGKCGEIFVLDMGEPVKIIDLARKMITLYGLEPDTDIKIEFSGIRPGEKLYEELFFDNELTEQTNNLKIRMAKTSRVEFGVLDRIRVLEELPANTHPDILIMAMSDIVPEAKLSNLEIHRALNERQES
jgi:FlaA1/EpsC-like NDP-sugar epimerase